jgi:hypothetical protein
MKMRMRMKRKRKRKRKSAEPPSETVLHKAPLQGTLAPS